MDTTDTQEAIQQDWQSLVDQWKQSGLSKAAFCRSANVNKDHFYYHSQQLEKRAMKKDSSDFIELKPKAVALTDQQSTPIHFKLSSNHGSSLEWSAPWSQHELIEFLKQWS